MKKRINWIDWGKALAAIAVVFCHLQQSQEWFYYRYLQAVTLVVFFFISGYLKKDRGSNKENWKKYWQGLIIPYLLYNAIIYPFWFIKYIILNSRVPDLFTAFKPIWGALLLEHENAFCEPLNGPLWYLPAILFMHLLIDLCRKTKHQHIYLVVCCVLFFSLYAANKYWYFAPNLTPMGLMRSLPFYYIGYVFAQYHLFYGTNLKKDIIGFILCFAASIYLFSLHLHAFYTNQHMMHIVLFYPANICFLFGVLYGCKVLNNIRLSFITNLSIGTLVIIGLHVILISCANFALEHLLHINGTICYQWYEALPVAIFIVVCLYPIILLGKKSMPILLGRQQT